MTKLPFCRRLPHEAPLCLPLAAVLGVLLGAWGIAAAVAALGWACLARAWRVAALVVLMALLCGGRQHIIEQRAQELSSLCEATELTGTVTRCLNGRYELDPGLLYPRVMVYGACGAVEGDRLCMLALPRAPRRYLSPYRRWAEPVAAFDLVRTEHRGRPLSFAALRAYAQGCRRVLARRLMPIGTEAQPERQVLVALILGEKSGADDETLETFLHGGCMHAFAVSGLHVGMLAAILTLLFRLLPLRPVVARPLILLLVAAYVFITGCAVSALRAYLMLAAVSGALILRRRLSLLNAWCGVALLVLAVDPSELRSAGALLSFGVYAAICCGCRLCMEHDAPWFGPDDYIPYRVMSPAELRWRRAERWLRGLVMVAVCAWLFSAPVTALLFHTVTPYGVLCNLAIALPLSCCMAAGLLHLALAGVPYLGAASGFAALKSAGVLLSIVQGFASLPCAYLPTVPPAPTDAVLMLPCGYGKHCCALGNPAVIIGDVSEETLRYELLPALFYTNTRPSAVVADEMPPLLREKYPDIRLLPSSLPARLSSGAGVFTVLPAPADAPAHPPTNRQPLLLWERSGHRLLYWGDAPATRVRLLPPVCLPVDDVLVGRHPVFRLMPEDMVDLGNPHVRRLPCVIPERRR